MRRWLPVWLGLPLLGAVAAAHAQHLSSYERERGLVMLRTIRKDLEKHYYDSTFHGRDLAALFNSAEGEVRSAQSNGEIFGIIAEMLVRLDDSHTFFLPPERVVQVDYGWTMRTVGDTAYIVDVEPRSDAEAQGLKVGDAVLGVDRFKPTRRDLLKLLYLYHGLSPRDAVTLIVRSPGVGAVPRRILVRAKVTPGKSIVDLSGRDGGTDIWDIVRHQENASRAGADRFAAVGGDVLVWELKGFNDKDQMDRGMDRAAEYAGLVVDARNNAGGYEHALLRLMGHLLDHVDTIGTIHRRHEMTPLISKPVGRPYTGKLVVLVDAGSASASEVFARTMQLARRGTILGDTTAGAVMRSMGWPHTVGVDIVAPYLVAVTDADIVMADGGRLEKAGVVPDEAILPTGSDIAAGRDPALALAITRAGHPIDADSAGRLLPRDRRDK